MKLTAISIAVIALTSNFANASWNVDERCLKNSTEWALGLKHSNEIKDDEPADLVFPSDAHDIGYYKAVSPPINLRGSDARAHRELEVATFQVEMHWEEGNCWQEEWEKRSWCWQCEDDRCNSDDYINIRMCSDSISQRFVYEPVDGTNGGKIKPYTRQDLCWTRTRVNAHQLKSCGNNFVDNQGRDLQILIGFQYHQSFELHPNGHEDPNKTETFKCMVNHHHPKEKEILRADYCSVGRTSKTNLWDCINIEREIQEVPNPASPQPTPRPVTVPTPTPGTLPKLRDLGKEYCDKHKCKLCEGDCDEDSQCEGNLKCYERKREGDEVPGCSGGGAAKSLSDFCYDPSAEQVLTYRSNESKIDKKRPKVLRW